MCDYLQLQHCYKEKEVEKWESLAAGRPTNWTCAVGNNRDLVLNQKARNSLQECPLTSTHVVWHIYNQSHRQDVTHTLDTPKKYKGLKKSPADFYPPHSHTHTHTCGFLHDNISKISCFRSSSAGHGVQSLAHDRHQLCH